MGKTMQGRGGYYIVQAVTIMVLVMLGFTTSGCEVIGDIFQAGMWVGVIIVAVVVLGIIMLVRMFKK